MKTLDQVNGWKLSHGSSRRCNLDEIQFWHSCCSLIRSWISHTKRKALDMWLFQENSLYWPIVKDDKIYKKYCLMVKIPVVTMVNGHESSNISGRKQLTPAVGKYLYYFIWWWWYWKSWKNLEILAIVIKKACECIVCIVCVWCWWHDIMLDLITFHHND